MAKDNMMMLLLVAGGAAAIYAVTQSQKKNYPPATVPNSGATVYLPPSNVNPGGTPAGPNDPYLASTQKWDIKMLEIDYYKKLFDTIKDIDFTWT